MPVEIWYLIAMFAVVTVGFTLLKRPLYECMLAGFIAAASRGETAAVCLQTAVAYGTAACLSEGSLPPTADQIAAIYPQITLTQPL